MSKKCNSRLRSQQWFDNPENPGMTALYIERSLNFGLTPEELRSGKPIIGIAQTGSDISPCNRVHIKLAERVREEGLCPLFVTTRQLLKQNVAGPRPTGKTLHTNLVLPALARCPSVKTIHK